MSVETVFCLSATFKFPPIYDDLNPSLMLTDPLNLGRLYPRCFGDRIRVNIGARKS